MHVAVKNHALPVFKKNRIALLLCIFETIIYMNIKEINSIFGRFMESWSPKGFTLTLHETQSIHDSMNLPKNEFITYI